MTGMGNGYVISDYTLDRISDTITDKIAKRRPDMVSDDDHRDDIAFKAYRRLEQAIDEYLHDLEYGAAADEVADLIIEQRIRETEGASRLPPARPQPVSAQIHYNSRGAREQGGEASA